MAVKTFELVNQWENAMILMNDLANNSEPHEMEAAKLIADKTRGRRGDPNTIRGRGYDPGTLRRSMKECDF